MARWSRKQVEQLAPDDKSIKAALKLARPGPWSDTGSTEFLVWGKCQGSGSTPYQVSVDLTGPAAKCSCPSRKFPCKHGLALLFLWVDGGGAISDVAEPADFAGDWAAERAGRAAGGAKRPAADRQTTEPNDPEAQARRLERRLALMTSGVDEFEIWLSDLYRHGLAAARRQPYAFWDGAAARLLDSQLPGLAARVRATPAEVSRRHDWADHLLVETGRWFTAIRAWHRRDVLPVDDVGNLRQFIGWTFATDDVRSTDPLADRWIVEGVRRTDDGRLQAQRTWIRGQTTEERLVVLDFAAMGAALGVAHVVGSVISTPLTAYPGSGVRRGLFLDTPVTTESEPRLGAFGTIGAALGNVAANLGANPFADQIPIGVRAAVVADDDEAYVVDEVGAALPLSDDTDPWPIVARTGASLVPIFAEYEDGRVRPLTIEVNGELIPV